MRVLILGAGVIGVTTAWYLRQAGHEVAVVDRQPGPALETSYANAGQLSYGYTSPWAAPGVPLKAIKWLFQKHAPLAIRLTSNPAQYRWMLQLLRNCTHARYAVNKARMVRMSDYSHVCTNRLSAELGIEYEGRSLGTTQVFRTRKQLDAAAEDIRILEQYNVPYELLDRAGIVRAEPALAASVDKLVGALRLPRDQTGDCHIFTERLTAAAAAAGVEFRWNQTIERISADGDRIDGVQIDGRLETADRYVVALGSYSTPMLKPLGLRLPVYPLKGYSLTLPIGEPARAPVSTILDESYKIAITRFDERIRVGGMAEVAGFDLALEARRRATLEMVVNDLFPQAGDGRGAEFWTGLRAATPDGTPIIGATPYRNLYLNTGHGTLGWTMAAGCGSYLADVISGQTPQISTEGLDIFRYGGKAAPHTGAR